MKSAHILPIYIAAVALGFASPAVAQENLEMGKMWTFENPPLGYLQEEYGFTPEEGWLDTLRMASLRFGGGCSASFVSAKGLIMTNHHCVRDFVAQVQGANDWVANGFYANSMETELRVPGLTVQQLLSMEDVTARMNESIVEGDDDETVSSKRAENRNRISSEAGGIGLRAQVVSLFRGAVFQLYIYKLYDDIRLVCTPHLQTSPFGGDPDNFTYPRFGLDFSFVRAYENGAPVDTSENYFRWSQAGPQKGELVFVPGNPGSTNRLDTVAQLEYLRDAQYPIALGLIQGQLDVLKQAAENDPEVEKQYRTGILSLENSNKAFTGYLGGLLDEELMADKLLAEGSFRDRVRADRTLQAKYGDLWEKLADVAEQQTQLEPLIAFHTPLLGTGPLPKALAIVRALGPEVSDEERTGLRFMVNQIGMRMNPVQEGVYLDHLARSRQWLPADDPFLAEVMGNLDPAAAIARMAGSQLGDPAVVEELFTDGLDAMASSDDPAIRAARILAPLMEEHSRKIQELGVQSEVLGTLMGQALHAVYGDRVSPDATFTLRFSDGVVQGFPYNGTIAPYRTSFYGLYARNTEFDNEFPFNLPDIWLERMDRVDMTKGVNFVSTNDLIGGNSGSPVVNADLEVVGLVFDGNIEMLPNNFVYRSDVPRCVAVHVQGIMEALRKIYDADRIADELIGR